MNSELLRSLALCETDVEGALQRFSGDEELYVQLIFTFPNDPTMNNLQTALEARAWDDAFTAAHALKGLAGNMGFIPLFHAAAEMVLLIRSGRVGELDESKKEVRRCYNKVIAAISEHESSM